MKRIALAMLVLLCASPARAAQHYVTPGDSTTIALQLEHLKETMISFPEQPVSVTGAGEPFFQVEPGADFIMVRSLQPNARGNIFVHLGNKTIVTLSLSTRARGGESLVEIRYGKDRALRAEQNLKKPTAGPDGLQAMASSWDVVKLREKSKNGGFTCTARYALVLDDRIIVNYSVRNDGAEPFTIAEVRLRRITMGGFVGDAAVSAEDVPASGYLDTHTLSRGDTANGILVFQRVRLDHDQSYVIRFVGEGAEGPEFKVQI